MKDELIQLLGRLVENRDPGSQDGELLQLRVRQLHGVENRLPVALAHASVTSNVGLVRRQGAKQE